MSNEKPVRITVGDVKEVTEATTIQADTIQPRSVATTTPAYAPQVETGSGMVMIGGVIGFILLILSAYYGFAGGQENRSSAPSSIAPTSSTPTTPTEAPATNSPAATTTANNTPAANVAPAGNNAPASNAPAANAPVAAANNAPASNNASATNAPAANNAAH